MTIGPLMPASTTGQCTLTLSRRHRPSSLTVRDVWQEINMVMLLVERGKERLLCGLYRLYFPALHRIHFTVLACTMDPFAVL